MTLMKMFEFSMLPMSRLREPVTPIASVPTSGHSLFTFAVKNLYRILPGLWRRATDNPQPERQGCRGTITPFFTIEIQRDPASSGLLSNPGSRDDVVAACERPDHLLDSIYPSSCELLEEALPWLERSQLAQRVIDVHDLVEIGVPATRTTTAKLESILVDDSPLGAGSTGAEVTTVEKTRRVTNVR
jgi:hypothetical protein